MFGNRKKEHEDLRKYLDEAFEKTGKNISSTEKKLEENMKEKLEKSLKEILNQHLDEKLEKYQQENGRLLRRQSGSLEDILEELQRQGAETENVSGQLQELRDREAALVKLCCLLSDQREMIVRQLLSAGVLAEDAAAGWRRQVELMEQEAGKAGQQCAFLKIGMCGEKVDYDCHEVISVCAAQGEEQNGTVAQVFSVGYCYHGRIIKKAQVAAYRYEDLE